MVAEFGERGKPVTQSRLGAPESQRRGGVEEGIQPCYLS